METYELRALDSSGLVQKRQCFKVRDALKLVVRKWLRLAPFYYIFLFVGWKTCAFYDNGPVWNSMGNLWYNCSELWWEKVLFVGNLFSF